ncbi:hypothetical protein Syun_015370 [Stephania yunnanensis]|uniref:Uncharacterized protein n=1 Tax=Stephania yunnanensis TaxID=152371 RepID=A0AAP0JLX0_9MAGN
MGQYDGKYLKGLLDRLPKDLKLHQTLTNVVIPTFDIKRLQPIVFSSYEKNHSLSVGTAVRSHDTWRMLTKRIQGYGMIPITNAESSSSGVEFISQAKERTKEIIATPRPWKELVDLSAFGKPDNSADAMTLVAISEMTKQVFRADPDFDQIMPLDYARFLVVSLGTGTAKGEEKYNAQMAAKWGFLG